jgi:hypothetical protein
MRRCRRRREVRAAVDAAAARHLTVWLEADLVRRWQDGRPLARSGRRDAGGTGRRQGVAGVKIADELGQDDA